MSLRETLPLFPPEQPTLILQSIDGSCGLMPCKTCGDTPQAVYREISRYGVKCWTSEIVSTVKEVIELWNRR